MADEFLPPVVTKLSGEIADLLGKLAEAKAAIDAFNKDVGDRSEAAGRSTGARSAEALLTEFRNRLKTGTLGDLTGPDNWRIRQDIFKAFEKAGADGSLKLLDSFAKALGPEGMQTSAGGAVMDAFNQFGLKGGMQAGMSFSGGFSGVLKTIFSNPATAIIGGAIVGSVVLELGAMIQGALLAGIGGGGLAVGIIGQLQDPQIKSAAADLGAFMKGKFQEASSPLHDEILSSISDLKRQTGPIFDILKQNFTDLQPYLRPLIDSIGVFFKAAAPGWMDAVKAAGPVLLEVARNAQMMGNAFSTFFEQISHNKGAVEGLDLLFRLLSGTIVATGYVLHGLSGAFNGFVQFADWVEHNIDERIPVMGQILKGIGVDKYIDGIAHSYDGFGLAVGKAALGSQKLTTELDAQKAAVDKLRNAYDAWFSGGMQVDQANLALHQDLIDLTTSLAQNKGQWDLNTQAGHDHYQALLQAIQGAKDFYDAQVKQYGDNPKFREEEAKTIQNLLDQAKNGGLDAAAIQALNAQFGGLLDSLNSLNGMHVTYYVNGIGANNNQFYQGDPSKFAGGLAQGGLVRAAQGFLPPRDPGTLVLAGEPQTGGEVMIPQRGISQQRAAALGMAALSPYGLGVGPMGGGGATVVENHTHVYLGGQEIAHTVDMIYPGMMAKAGQRRKGFGNSGLAAPFNPAYPTGNTFGGT